MVLDPKHFDDMDDYCDFDERLESTGDSDLGDSGPNSALSWRRSIIERAANNVKKAYESKADLKSAHKIGSLIFDEKSSKFGRVLESRPGFLNLSLLAGGHVVRHDIDPLEFVRRNRRELTLPEIAKKLSLTEVEVLIFLNQIELEQEKMPTVKVIEKEPRQEKVKATKKPIKAKAGKAKPEVKVALHQPKLPKPSVKIAAKKKKSAPKKKVAISNDRAGFTKLLPKGATTDPVVDPNGYIQQNFLMMSNRELATATGLSEHTIRRKLGEWNLKRKDFVNKA